MPETRGRSLESIQEAFTRPNPVRQVDALLSGLRFRQPRPVVDLGSSISLQEGLEMPRITASET